MLAPFRRDTGALDLRARDEPNVLEDLEHIIFVVLHG